MLTYHPSLCGHNGIFLRALQACKLGTSYVVIGAEYFHNRFTKEEFGLSKSHLCKHFYFVNGLYYVLWFKMKFGLRFNNLYSRFSITSIALLSLLYFCVKHNFVFVFMILKQIVLL